MAFYTVPVTVAILLLGVCMLWINKCMFSLSCKKVYSGALTYTYEMFLVSFCIHFDIAEMVLLFCVFNRKVAGMLWLGSTLVNVYIFKYRAREWRWVKRLYDRVLEKQQRQSEKRPAKKKASLWKMKEKPQEPWQRILPSDVKDMNYGPVIVTPYVRYNWMLVHFAGLGFSVLLSLLHTIATTYHLYASVSFVMEEVIFDAFWWYGVAAIVYWIGYWLQNFKPWCDRKIRYEGWRNWYHLSYGVFFILWWALFIVLQLSTRGFF